MLSGTPTLAGAVDEMTEVPVAGGVISHFPFMDPLAVTLYSEIDKLAPDTTAVNIEMPV
jgi:hypothetical protein